MLDPAQIEAQPEGLTLTQSQFQKYKESKIKKILFEKLPMKTKNSIIKFLASKRINFTQLKKSKSTNIKFITENHEPIMVMLRGEELQHLGLRNPHISQYHVSCNGDVKYGKKDLNQWDGQFHNLRKYHPESTPSRSVSRKRKNHKSRSKSSHKRGKIGKENKGSLTTRESTYRCKDKKRAGSQTQRGNSSRSRSLKNRRKDWSNISNLKMSQEQKIHNAQSKMKKKQMRFGLMEGEVVESDGPQSQLPPIEEADYELFYTYEEMKKLWNTSERDMDPLQGNGISALKGHKSISDTLALSPERYQKLESGLQSSRKLKRSPYKLGRDKEEQLIEKVIKRAEIRARNKFNRDTYRKIAKKINSQQLKIRLNENVPFMDYEYDKLLDQEAKLNTSIRQKNKQLNAMNSNQKMVKSILGEIQKSELKKQPRKEYLQSKNELERAETDYRGYTLKQCFRTLEDYDAERALLLESVDKIKNLKELRLLPS